MEEWASYSLSDLLLFSPASYFRLFELSNQALWPFQIPLLLAAIAAASFIVRDKPRPALLILATLWAFVTWWWFYRHYGPIYPTAHSFGILFGIQALLLMIAAGAKRWLGELRSGVATQTGWVLFLYALLFHPLVIILTGRPLAGVELFGIAPDPTALGTLGLLLLRRGWMPNILVVIPLLWLVVSALTHLAMENSYGMIAPVMGWVVVILLAIKNRS